jgi:Uma2 family endonuclease
MAMRVILTYKDYDALPADGRRYELHDGELSVTAAPAPRDQQVSGNLFAMLRGHVQSRGLGMVLYSPIDLVLSDTSIVQPDLVYLRSDQLTAITCRGIEAPPALLIEILSPTTAQIDRGVKLQLYARHRVPHYWIVDPAARRIEAHTLTGPGYELAATLEGRQQGALPPFPDLQLAPDDVSA